MDKNSSCMMIHKIIHTLKLKEILRILYLIQLNDRVVNGRAALIFFSFRST